MRGLARIEDTHRVTQEVAVVEREEDAALLVRSDGGLHRARRAASCLVEPVPGDVVLVSHAWPGGRYVLAILERKEGTPTRVAPDGDLEIRVRGGRLAVVARDGVDAVTGGDLSLAANGVLVNAVEGTAVLQRLSCLATFVHAESERVRVLAGMFDSVLGRLWQRVKRSYRRVEELDEVKARQIDYCAEELAGLRGETTLVTAKVLVKLDGEQVHLG